jgi:ubiquitin-like domain-containing CTD phosphatase 1
MDATMADASAPQAAPLEPPVAATTAPEPELAIPAEVVYALICNWKGQKLDVNVVASDTVGDLKALLWSLTSVPVERQKIVGLVKGKLPGDEAEVVSLGLLQGGGSPKPFMMVSCRLERSRRVVA